MNTTETQLPSKPAVASSDGLEAKRYGQFTYWYDRGMPRVETVIGDFDCNRITRFHRELSNEEVVMFCEGYETGNRHGVETGKTIKANEVKRALGL